MAGYTPGRILNARYFRHAVSPILAARYPHLRYTAALIGPGSEVLGYDTALSRDHDWGPRVQLFLRPEDSRRLRTRIRQTIGRALQPSFSGLDTRFTAPNADGVRVRDRKGEPNLWIGTIPEFFSDYLGVPSDRPWGYSEWLLVPQNKLLSVTRGPIFRDDLGLARFRSRFRYYPRDVWLHLLSVQWLRISEEEAFVGRAGAVGDAVGARLIAARQVREMMRLAFLLERSYMPYDKWFGTAFRELALAPRLLPLLLGALDSKSPATRERFLSRSYELLAKEQNRLRVARALPSHVSRYHDRPYRVLHCERFAREIRRRIRSPRIRGLTSIGSIDQFGNTETLGSTRDQLSGLRFVIDGRKPDT